MANQAVEQLMQAMQQGRGGSPMHVSTRGNDYARQMSQRSPGNTVRTISNAPQIGSPLGGMATVPDYAGRTATGFGGLSGGQEMELQQNGYTDIGNVRYVLDRSTGQVTQMPRPGSGYGDGPPSNYGSQTPVSLMDAIRRGR